MEILINSGLLADKTNIIERLPFMHTLWVDNRYDLIITRCGYTGEDGFEISVPNNVAIEVATILLKSPLLRLAGLAARDILRLEAGMCLYGNDLDEETTPIEASLGWTIAKGRILETTSPSFVGRNVIVDQINGEKMKKRRFGFISPSGPPPRSNAKIVDAMNNGVGRITSGTFSPTLGHNVAMGYLYANDPQEWLKYPINCESLFVIIRDKSYPLKVVKMPFVSNRYYNNSVKPKK